MAACRQLGFDVTGNSAIRSADPENSNQTSSVSDHPLRRFGHWRILGAYGTPFGGEGEVVGDQRWHHSRAMVAS